MRTVSPSDADRDAQGNPIPRNWAWSGCHSAGGLMTHLLRLMNVPASSPKAYQWPQGSTQTGYHRGVNVPTERLALWHADDLYARDDLMDPSIDMATVYNLGLDYDVYRALFADPPKDANESSEQWTEFARWTGRIAVQNAAYSALYWCMFCIAQLQDVDPAADPWTTPSFLSSIKNQIAAKWHLTSADSDQLWSANEQKFRDKTSQFHAGHAVEIDAIALNEGVTSGWAAFFLLERKHNEWLWQR